MEKKTSWGQNKNWRLEKDKNKTSTSGAHQAASHAAKEGKEEFRRVAQEMNANPSQVPILHINYDLFDWITSYISGKDVLQLSHTCRQLRAYIQQRDSIWATQLCFLDRDLLSLYKGEALLMLQPLVADLRRRRWEEGDAGGNSAHVASSFHQYLIAMCIYSLDAIRRFHFDEFSYAFLNHQNKAAIHAATNDHRTVNDVDVLIAANEAPSRSNTMDVLLDRPYGIFSASLHGRQLRFSAAVHSRFTQAIQEEGWREAQEDKEDRERGGTDGIMGEIERIARRQKLEAANNAAAAAAGGSGTVDVQAIPNHQWPQVGHPIINKHVPLIPLYIFKVLTRKRQGTDDGTDGKRNLNGSNNNHHTYTTSSSSSAAAAAAWDVDLGINDIFAGIAMIASAKRHGFLTDDTTDEYLGDDQSHYLSNEYKLLRTEKVDTKDNQGKKHKHKNKKKKQLKKLLHAQGTEAAEPVVAEDEEDEEEEEEENEEDTKPYRQIYAEALRYTLSTARFRRLHLGSHHRAIRNNGQTRRARLPGNRNNNNNNNDNNDNNNQPEAAVAGAPPQEAGEQEEAVAAVAPDSNNNNNTDDNGNEDAVDAAAVPGEEEPEAPAHAGGPHEGTHQHFDHNDATLPPANKILASFTGCLLEIQEQEAAKLLDMYLGKRDRREIMHLFLLRNLFLHKFEFHDLESYVALNACSSLNNRREKEELGTEDPLMGEDLCETFARHYEQGRLEKCLLGADSPSAASPKSDFNLTDVIFSVHENYTHFYLIPELCYNEDDNDLQEGGSRRRGRGSHGRGGRGGAHHHNNNNNNNHRTHTRGRIGLVIADGIRTLIIVGQRKQTEDERSRTEAAYYYHQARENESYYNTNNNNQTGVFNEYL